MGLSLFRLQHHGIRTDQLRLLVRTEVDIDMLFHFHHVPGAHLRDQHRADLFDHSVVKGKWSLFYGSKQASAGESGGPLTVTVEDKTRKVELRK